METAQQPATAAVGASRGDALLRDLGVVRLELAIPFTEAGGRVNVFVIDNPDGSLTLFDAGLGYEVASQALVAGLAAVGRRVEEVQRVIVSHGHLDHYGGARFVRARAGACVLVHPRDAAKIRPPVDPDGDDAMMARYLVRLGAPPASISALQKLYRQQLTLAEQVDETEPLAAGQRFEFRCFTGEVVPMPGHTPGLVCLHAPAHRFMFTSDQLLGFISPNPLIELGPRGEEDKFRALVAHLDSARRLRALDLEWILPGHGRPFTGHRRILDSLREFYELRQAKIRAALAAAPRTPYELVHDIFRRGINTQLYLMLSEILGNLEVLEDQGAVERVPGAVPYRYRLTATHPAAAGAGPTAGA